MTRAFIKHTEKAFRAWRRTNEQHLLVYLPPGYRADRVEIEGAVLRADDLPPPKNAKERIEREADPIGFLTAVANGQPILMWEIDKITGEPTPQVQVPSLEMRIAVAERLRKTILADKRVQGKDKEAPLPVQSDFEQMINEASASETP